MAYIISDNITSPLGDSTADNLASLKAGRTALRRHEAAEMRVGEAFTASLSDKYTTDGGDGLTPFERISLHSIGEALKGCQGRVDLGGGRTILILSTTKGNVEGLLDGSARVLPVDGGQKIAERLGLTTVPIVVCDACISGLAALILGNRLIGMGACDTAIVCGADIPRRFIVSGFQSLRAVSADSCRPFDMERNGLNLGEAAATIILTSSPDGARWHIDSGAIRNDAYHLSAPHKRGEGLRLAIESALAGRDTSEVSLISAHGTATLFNDQMESVAIERAGLSAIPVNGLKGYYGHTMGAAGILETIVSMHTLDGGFALPTRGYAEPGVSGRINVTAGETVIGGGRKTLLKLLSGFGGCNAAALISAGEAKAYNKTCRELKRTHRVVVTPTSAVADGVGIDLTDDGGGDILTRIYKQRIGGYAKFYKMDMLSRLGFVATELLLGLETDGERFVERADRAVVMFNRTSSLHTDKAFAEGVRDTDNYYPSPSAFIYTLPNIVTGEVAIRNMYHGETSFYMMRERNEAAMERIIEATFADSATKSVVGGWVDFENETTFEADISIFVGE